MADPVIEAAPAKLNLALHVTGRRADGYHSLEMLVAFAEIGDELEAVPAKKDSLAITGPFAKALGNSDSNLVLRALEHLLELVTIPLQGEHYTRRPLKTVQDLGLTIVDTERLTYGAIERVHARKPAAG